MTTTTNTTEQLPETVRAKRRTACFILDHDVRRNRGLLSKAFTRVLGAQKHHTEPHYIDYAAADSEGACSGDPAYRLDVSDDEFTKILEAADDLGAAFDAYHD
jgi:hypothetical protein